MHALYTVQKSCLSSGWHRLASCAEQVLISMFTMSGKRFSLRGANERSVTTWRLVVIYSLMSFTGGVKAFPHALFISSSCSVFLVKHYYTHCVLNSAVSQELTRSDNRRGHPLKCLPIYHSGSRSRPLFDSTEIWVAAAAHFSTCKDIYRGSLLLAKERNVASMIGASRTYVT